MWTWLVLCANKEERCLVFWDYSKVHLPIPLLWSKESKESEKEIAWSLHFVKPSS
jgi:hypothetical protein